MLSPTPALPALAVEVAAVEIVHDDYREFLDEKAVDRLSPEIIVSDDLGLPYTIRQQRRRTLDGPEVHATVLPHRLDHRLGAHSLTDHSPQTAFDQERRVRVHPGGGRRPGGPQRATRSRRGRARVVHDVSFQIQRQRIAGFYRLFHPGVSRIAGYVDHPVEAYDVAYPHGLDLLFAAGRC